MPPTDSYFPLLGQVCGVAGAVAVVAAAGAASERQEASCFAVPALVGAAAGGGGVFYWQSEIVKATEAKAAADAVAAAEALKEAGEKEALLKKLLSEASFSPRKIMILFGPPGAGKGTQASLQEAAAPPRLSQSHALPPPALSPRIPPYPRAPRSRSCWACLSCPRATCCGRPWRRRPRWVRRRRG